MAGPSDRRDVLRHASAGIEFAVTFGVFVAGGYLLDRHLGWPPAFLYLGMMVGFALALRQLLQHARELNRRANRQRAGLDEPSEDEPGEDESGQDKAGPTDSGEVD